MQQNLQFLIIEDHDVVVWALKSAIGKDFSESVTHSVSGFNEGLRLLKETGAGIVIMDIDVVGGNSPRMISSLRKVNPRAKVLVYTGFEEDENTLRYLLEGADGFVTKGAAFDTVREAIRTVVQGRRYLSLHTQMLIADNFLKHPFKRVDRYEKERFSEREIQIICLLAKGLGAKEISNRLDLKLSTVSTHKLRIFEKFDVENVIEMYKKVSKQMPELLE